VETYSLRQTFISLRLRNRLDIMAIWNQRIGERNAPFISFNIVERSLTDTEQLIEKFANHKSKPNNQQTKVNVNYLH